MGKPLVIVESPTKARTIEKFLGKEYVIRASYGHVRDLPDKAAEIPAKYKSEQWSRLGVNVENDFEPLYIIPSGKKKHIKELKTLLKQAPEVYLATDEDREGESISWHLLEVLSPKIPVKRLVFHEITKSAIQRSFETARDINENLVRAQETRRIVDRLYGYSVSPLLWKKMARGLSAGRVQSVAMRLLVERERERIAFTSAEYWDLKGEFEKVGAPGICEAELQSLGGKRIASGKDFDQNTGKLKNDKVVLLGKSEAEALRERLVAENATVTDVEKKPYSTKPSPPFTTSTLQQEAGRKLSFSASRTMQVAQTLYENGFITYMRTDSTTLSQEALDAARSHILDQYGKEYLPDQPRVYKTKVKNAQEAHEAIRPAGAEFASMDRVKRQLGVEAFKLYELIWKKTMASQMADARGHRIRVDITADDAVFRASGKTIDFPGFMRAYVEGSDDPEAELADQEKLLPDFAVGDSVKPKKLEVLEHHTQPPARYTEGSLIKELEKRGIGRPSTWASIVGVILARNYATKRGTALVPSFLAMALTSMLETHFTSLMDYSFTASLEDDLDAIARGEADSLKYLNSFYFGNGFKGIKKLVEEGEEGIDPRVVCGMPIGKSGEQDKIEVRIGRYGPFLSDGENRASVPEGIAPDELSPEKAHEVLEAAAKGPEPLGDHPETGEAVFLKTGRFGPYVQLGEGSDGEKPKMASLLSGMQPDQVTLEIAVKLLSLPRDLGKYEDLGEQIMAANGRYGPYIKCGSETRSLPDELSPIEITFEQAVELLKQPKKGGRRKTPATLKELGKHPGTEQPIQMKSGRYGPYVTDGEINASIPRGTDPDTVTLEQALNLLEVRAQKIAEKGGPKKKAKAKKSKSKAKSSTKKQATKKKGAAKKSTTKKKAAKKASSKKEAAGS